jgi:hypothetical protein
LSYQYVNDFRGGMDRTRARHAPKPGTLWLAKDCVINRSGEPERRLPFRSMKTLPANVTHGGYKLGTQFYVFGSVATPSGLPSDTVYVRLQHPFGVSMVEVLDVEPFFGRLYVIAQFADGSIHHFFDGARVTDWDKLTTPYASFADLTAAFASLINGNTLFSAVASGAFLDITGHSGVEFELTVESRNGGVSTDQNAVVSELQALGTVIQPVAATATITVDSGTAGEAGVYTSAITLEAQARTNFAVNSLTVGGTQLLAGPVSYTGAQFYDDHAARAELVTLVAASINSRSHIHGYTADTLIIAPVNEMEGGVPIIIPGEYSLILTTSNAAVDGVTPVLTGLTNAAATPTPFDGTSTAANLLTSLTVSGTELLARAVPYGASQAATAAALAAAINDRSTTHGYNATVVGNTITLRAPPALGDGVNTVSAVASVTGDFDLTIGAFSGGVDGSTTAQQVQRITFSGTFEARDTWTVKLNGAPFSLSGEAFQPGRQALIFKKKVYSNAGSVLVFSALRNAMDFTNGIGAGFVNASAERRGDIQITSLEEYAGSMAVFTAQNIYFFDMNEDEDLNRLLYTVENIGSIAEKSAQPFGSRDVFFLAWSGVRSLRSQNATDRAFVSDVGTPIDPFVLDWMGAQTADVISRAKSIIDPKDNRYILSIGTRAFVFSYFPDEKVSAWTYWDLPSEPKCWFRDEKLLYVRFGDVIYAYGGADGKTTPNLNEVTARIELPFYDARSPAHFKNWSGFDLGVVGDWRVWVIPDVNEDDELVELGTVNGVTYNKGDQPFDLRSTHIAVVLECASAGAAKLTDIALHYNGSVDQN